jgi:hypothetical protein
VLLLVFGCSSLWCCLWALLVMLLVAYGWLCCCLFLGVLCCDFSSKCSLPCYCFFFGCSLLPFFFWALLNMLFLFGALHHEALWALFTMLLLAFGRSSPC